MRTLLVSLTDHPIALLRGIAELRGVALATNVRDDAADQLAAALTGPAATEAALLACSAAAQRAWAGLAAAGRRMPAPAFARRHGAIRPAGPGKLEREQIWLQPESPAEELWYRGLIFRAFADFGDGPAEYIYIPDDLPLPSGLAVAARPTPAVLPQAQPPARTRQWGNALAVDLCAMLAALRDRPARLDSAGRLRPADLTYLQGGLLLADPLRIEFALTLGRAAGWLTLEVAPRGAGGHGRTVFESQPATAWLRATHWEQMTALFAAWRDATDAVPGRPAAEPGWNDLRRMPELQAEGPWRNDPLLARRAILGVLSALEPETWYGIGDLIAVIKATDPDFQRPDGAYTGWYLRDVETGGYLTGFEAWDQVEGRLIRFVITGPLFWLGAVALGDAADGRVQSFCLTPGGAAWLSDKAPADLPRPAHLAMGEDFVVAAPLLLPLLDRFRLLRFTEPAQPKDLEGLQDLRGLPPGMPSATRHRITRGSLARARSTGVKGDAILQFLQRASGGRVPPRVAAGLTRWDQHGGAVRIQRGAVLRVEDAAVLANLRADPAVAPLLGDLLSAQAVLVSEPNLRKLQHALEELGYTTRVE